MGAAAIMVLRRKGGEMVREKFSRTISQHSPGECYGDSNPVLKRPFISAQWAKATNRGCQSCFQKCIKQRPSLATMSSHALLLLLHSHYFIQESRPAARRPFINRKLSTEPTKRTAAVTAASNSRLTSTSVVAAPATLLLRLTQAVCREKGE